MVKSFKGYMQFLTPGTFQMPKMTTIPPELLAFYIVQKAPLPAYAMIYECAVRMPVSQVGRGLLTTYSTTI
jgi:hypothetical protein